MRRLNCRAALVALALAAGCASSAPPAVLDSTARFTHEVELAAPELDGPMMLNEAIVLRRSAREYSSEPVPLNVVGQLLWAGQGITSARGLRTSPSAGAHYPLELYVVTAIEVLHYLPEGHRVEWRDSTDLRSDLQAAAFGQPQVGSAPAVVVIAAVFERTELEYGALAHDFVNREAGHAAQNVLLQATAQGLDAVPMGGFNSATVATLLALPPDHEVLYLIPVGFPIEPAP